MRRTRSKTFKLAIAGTLLSGLLFSVMIFSIGRVFGFIGSSYGFAVANGSLLLGSCSSWRSQMGWVMYDPFEVSTLGWVPSHAFDRSRSIQLELWKPLLGLIILTGIVFLTNRFRFPLSHCQRCGYDLRGNLSRVCPECGTSCVKWKSGDPTETDSRADSD